LNKIDKSAINYFIVARILTLVFIIIGFIVALVPLMKFYSITTIPERVDSKSQKEEINKLIKINRQKADTKKIEANRENVINIDNEDKIIRPDETNMINNQNNQNNQYNERKTLTTNFKRKIKN
jgi:hypothetical protein